MKNSIRKKKHIKKSKIRNSKRGGRPGKRWCDDELYLNFKKEFSKKSPNSFISDPRYCDSNNMWDKFQAWKAIKNGLILPKNANIEKWELITANARSKISLRDAPIIIWRSIPIQYFFSSEKMVGLWETVEKYYSNVYSIEPLGEIIIESEPERMGITLGKSNIRKLSGPVSFYFLKPNVGLDEEHYFPLIMLFGDRHRSKINSCKSCYCEKDSCCYSITDIPFLQLIDTLAQRYPIDFYTETVFSGMGSGFKNGYMEDLTTGPFMTCYHRSVRNTHLDKCPTKHIRWHAADARYMGSAAISTLVDTDDFMKNFEKNISSKKFLNDEYIEPQFTIIIDYLNDGFKMLSTKLDDVKTIVFVLLDCSKFISKTYFKTMRNFMQFILKSFETKDTTKLSENLFEIMNEENSLIVKQINKQTYFPFMQKSYWKKLFINNNDLSDDEIFNIDVDFVKSNLLTDIDIVFDCLEKNKIEDINVDHMMIYHDFFYRIQSWLCVKLLDFYAITRIMKQPTDGNRSFLSFGYFGNFHVKNIVKLLIEMGMYTIVEKIDAVEENRCLDLQFSINLDKELKQRDFTFKY